MKYRQTTIYRQFSACLSVILAVSLVIPAQAQSVLNLPQPGTMIPLSVSYNPAIVKGISIYPDNPLKFDFIIDPGDDNLQGDALKKEADKLIKYFMASLTVPEDEMWVNLSPYEEDRIVADGLSQTELGRDLLAQDYILKQVTASLMYPEEELGSDFWQRVYAKAQERYGTSEIPMNTFNKVWIVPQKANVFVNGNNVFVVDNYLKVMLEEDYLALESNLGHNKHGVGEIPEAQVKEIRDVSKQVIREVLIPEIEKEVNQGKNFANLRQIFNSMILATWYKKNLRESLLGQVYVNQNKVEGIDLEDKQVKEKIYTQYVQAFQKGVFNFIKEDYDETTQEIIPRKYFSGGIEGTDEATLSEREVDSAERRELLGGDEQVFTVENRGIVENESGDSAMLAFKEVVLSDMKLNVHGDFPQGAFDFLTSAITEIHQTTSTSDSIKIAQILRKSIPQSRIWGALNLLESDGSISRPKEWEPPMGYYSNVIPHWISYLTIDGLHLAIDLGAKKYLKGQEIDATIIIANDEQTLKQKLMTYYGGKQWGTFEELYSLDSQIETLEDGLTTSESSEEMFQDGDNKIVFSNVDGDLDIRKYESRIPGPTQSANKGGTSAVRMLLQMNGQYLKLSGDTIAHIMDELELNARERSREGIVSQEVYLYQSGEKDGKRTFALRLTYLQKGLEKDENWQMLERKAEEFRQKGSKFLVESSDWGDSSEKGVSYVNKGTAMFYIGLLMEKTSVHLEYEKLDDDVVKTDIWIDLEPLEKDEAMIAFSQSPVENPGGIDLNPNNLELNVQGNEIKINLTNPQILNNISVDGFIPVIINVSPISNLPLLLGESDNQEDSLELSRN